MNIQAIICSFILSIGAVMVCVTTRTVDDDHEFKGKTALAIEIIGIIMVCVGGLGYLFTIYEVIKRGHDKLSKGKMRKLEQQVKQRRDTAIRRMTELRAETLCLPIETTSTEESEESSISEDRQRF